MHLPAFISLLCVSWLFQSPQFLPAEPQNVSHASIPPVKLSTNHDPKHQTPSFSFAKLYNLTTNFFDTFLYPANAVEAKKINSTLFSKDVLGRVDATRNFDGRELNTEYAFGLFANIALNPKHFTLLGIPTSYELTHFSANQNIVSASVVADFNITALNFISPVEVDIWFTFNANEEISQYDATFRWLQWQFDTLFELGKIAFHVNSTEEVKRKVTSLLADAICDTTQSNCHGKDRQYASHDACVRHLSSGMPFGAAHMLGMDTLLCRMVHVNMVPVRPGVHCPHVGPTGGGYCTDDRTYTGTVRQNYFTNSPFIPYGYGPKAVDMGTTP